MLKLYVCAITLVFLFFLKAKHGFWGSNSGYHASIVLSCLPSPSLFYIDIIIYQLSFLLLYLVFLLNHLQANVCWSTRVYRQRELSLGLSWLKKPCTRWPVGLWRLDQSLGQWWKCAWWEPQNPCSMQPLFTGSHTFILRVPWSIFLSFYPCKTRDCMIHLGGSQAGRERETMYMPLWVPQFRHLEQSYYSTLCCWNVFLSSRSWYYYAFTPNTFAIYKCQVAIQNGEV